MCEDKTTSVGTNTSLQVSPVSDRVNSFIVRYLEEDNVLQENVSVKCISPYTTLLCSKTGVCRGIPIFLIFDQKKKKKIINKNIGQVVLMCTHIFFFLFFFFLLHAFWLHGKLNYFIIFSSQAIGGGLKQSKAHLIIREEEHCPSFINPEKYTLPLDQKAKLYEP